MLYLTRVQLSVLSSNLLYALSTLDDVLLSYITGVLEDLGSQQSVEENFDVEVFAEMLEAYIPGFAEIDRSEQHFRQRLSNSGPRGLQDRDKAPADFAEVFFN